MTRYQLWLGLVLILPSLLLASCAIGGSSGAVAQAVTTASPSPDLAASVSCTSAKAGGTAAPYAGLTGQVASNCVSAESVAPMVTVEGGGGYHNVSPLQLNAMLKAKDFRFINVHTPYAGEIDGTDVFMPFDQIERHLKDLPADKGAKIVLYCRSGAMSALAARSLVKLGYNNVWNLNGGMYAWENAGYPIANKQH